MAPSRSWWKAQERKVRRASAEGFRWNRSCWRGCDDGQSQKATAGSAKRTRDEGRQARSWFADGKRSKGRVGLLSREMGSHFRGNGRREWRQCHRSACAHLGTGGRPWRATLCAPGRPGAVDVCSCRVAPEKSVQVQREILHRKRRRNLRQSHLRTESSLSVLVADRRRLGTQESRARCSKKFRRLELGSNLG